MHSHKLKYCPQALAQLSAAAANEQFVYTKVRVPDLSLWVQAIDA